MGQQSPESFHGGQSVPDLFLGSTVLRQEGQALGPLLWGHVVPGGDSSLARQSRESQAPGCQDLSGGAHIRPAPGAGKDS